MANSNTPPATKADVAPTGSARWIEQRGGEGTGQEAPPRIVTDPNAPLLPGQTRINPVDGTVLEGAPITMEEVQAFALAELGASFGSRTISVDGFDKEVYFKLAFGKDPVTGEDRGRNTKDAIADWAKGNTRKNELPQYVAPWECRIGGSLFVVPPISINVSTAFKAGAITGGALRQSSSPKFNSGYSETVVELTLYFPNHESIWGFEGDEATINFDKDGDDSRIIDKFLSSLRGLITQFRYAPFLPVRNAYLNNVHGISAVALQSMTVSTIPGYPFCMAVNLTMLKFNHQVYLPMIDHFDAAVHWGKFRQYLGRCAARMANVASQKFLMKEDIKTDKAGQPLGTVDPTLISPDDELELQKMAVEVTSADEVLKRADVEDLTPVRSFNKITEIEDGLGYKWGAPSHFELYYPYHDPARIDLPDLKDFKPEDEISAQKGLNWWQSLLTHLGIEPASSDYVSADSARSAWISLGKQDDLSSEATNLMNWTQAVKILVDTMSPARFEEYAAQRIKEKGLTGEAAKAFKENTLRTVWNGTMYDMFSQNPFFAKKLALQQLKQGKILIDEWEVPMQKVGLADAGIREYIQVQQVTVSMGNNIARMQVQMHAEPCHQHIGGMDTTCSISMLVFGEKPLLMLRRTFDTVSGLARIEHGHGVLGFLGIKNIITALCGMRYCMPASFEVDSVPNFPHVYQVRLTMTDFDVFQQKREILSAEQQAEMINTFKTKKNPFLRVKQLWGRFNAYPDFPLSVRDENGSVIGCLDPDFYFNAYQMVDDDIIELSPDERNREEQAADVTKRSETVSMEFLKEDGVHWAFGKSDDARGDWLSITKNGITTRNGGKVVDGMIDTQFNEMTAENTLLTPTVPGHTPGADYIKPFEVGQKLTDTNGNSLPPGNNLLRQWQSVMADWQYRDKSGRMIRAFPTYMLWLISENGTYAGVKLFDNFYGLQSVVDFSVHQSEDVMGDTLVLRISNIYSRLSTPFKDLLDARYSGVAKIINEFQSEMARKVTGMTDYLMNLDTVEIAPGARVHLRIGYSSNPNAMDTVFNGVITEVETGEIMTLTCQSDAIELAALVNTTNAKGSSGKIDGTMFGFYMSEPRDLMCQLLAMGSGVFREVFAHATQGKIFSENRFGIRHFGSILYSALSDSEQEKQDQKKERLAQSDAQYTRNSEVGSAAIGNEQTGIVGLVNPVIGDVISDMLSNLSIKRDYEIFKRNIYPGNGVGIAQYMGGDIGDGGINVALLPTGVNSMGKISDSLTGQTFEIDTKPLATLNETIELKNQLAGVDPEQGRQSKLHTFAQMMGITSRSDDDIGGFDEYAFRASTYMKTVWDMFQVCAALLPNYIVAVRPFEDRSTVFYGKPGWTYTSGVIPLTYGVGLVVDRSGKEINTEPEYELDDAEWRKLYDTLTQEVGQDRQLEDFYQALSGVQSVDPHVTVSGIAWDDELPSSFPTSITRKGKTINLVLAQDYKPTVLKLGMHLPVADGLGADKKAHLEVEGLTPQWGHPFFMDRAGVTEIGSGSGGLDAGTDGTGMAEWSAGGSPGDAIENRNDDGASDQALFKEDQDFWDGVPGWYGILKPEDEQFYIAMAWNEDQKEALQNTRILVYCPRTNRACICTPGNRVGGKKPTEESTWEEIPGQRGDVYVSPDTMFILGAQEGRDQCFIGFVSEQYEPGPVDLSNYRKNASDDAAPTNDPTAEGVLPAWTKADARIQEAVNASTAQLLGVKIPGVPEGEKDPMKFAFEWGWSLAKTGNVPVPVNFGGTNQDPESGLFDEAGSKAATLFGEHRKNADEIWNEFRQNFRTESLAVKIFGEAFPQFSFELGVGIPKELVDEHFRSLADVDRAIADLEAQEQKKYPLVYYVQFRDGTNANYPSRQQAEDAAKAGKGSLTGVGGYRPQDLDYSRRLGELSLARQQMFEHPEVEQYYRLLDQHPEAKGLNAKVIYDQVMDSFLQFMWKSPYNRGWLVGTADRQFQFWAGLAKSALTVAGVAGGVAITVGTGGIGTVALAAGAAAVSASSTVAASVERVTGGSVDTSKDWNFHQAHKVWKIFITDGPQSASAWMKENRSAGKDNTGIFSRLAEEVHEKVIKPIGDIAGQVARVVGGVVSGLAAFMRLTLMQLNNGLGMRNNMQRKTNMLNRLYNDSIYYAAGSVLPNGPSLARLADNPFTREYGEPVVEIREPFQRIHHVNSFQHILKNGIIETSDDVATVVTAVSNGSHPVTVHFDKGAPAEYQREKVVDTGLLWDKVDGLPFLKSIPLIGAITKPIAVIFSPVTTARGAIKTAKGVSDEISAKRVALYHLRESLKDIYTGELIVIGDASIRPHDLVYLGDVYCQPPGTKVAVVKRNGNRWGDGQTEAVNIEDLVEGDKVVSLDKAGYIHRRGKPITGISVNPFDGELVVAETDTGKRSRYTPRHRCIVRTATAFEGKWLVYMMEKGGQYRVGMTAGLSQVKRSACSERVLGLTLRMRSERADAGWVLSVHDSLKEAMVAEVINSYRYGIPQTRFVAGDTLLEQEHVDAIWEAVGKNHDRAELCLSYHGLDINLPFRRVGQNSSVSKTSEVTALNLYSGMEMRNESGEWERIRVSREAYAGPVYSLDVAIDETYLADGLFTHNSRMYGFFEVESVTHHFMPETGFITSIVPNAIVTVNDPGRWSMMSYWQNRNDKQAFRNHIRQTIRLRVDTQGGAGAGETLGAGDIVRMAENTYTDMTQYTGGMSAIVKDVVGSNVTGQLVKTAGSPPGQLVGAGAAGGGAAGLGGAALALTGASGGVLAAAGLAGAGIGASLGWGAWKWVRDNLLDQHGCYIQFLTRQGQPMDGGISPNSSVAVGRQHGTTFTLGSLNLGTLATEENGKKKITTSELLSAIGYNSKHVEEVNKFATKAAEDTYKRVGKLLNRGDALPGQYDIIWVKIKHVKDGDTIVVSEIPDAGDKTPLIVGGKVVPNGTLPAGHGKSNEIRMLVVDSPEDYFSDKNRLESQLFSEDGVPLTQEALAVARNSPGVRATEFTRARLLSVGQGPIAEAVLAQMERDGTDLKQYDYEVALRILKDTPLDRYFRTLAFIWHQGLKGQTKADRKKYIIEMAQSDADWQNYTSQGFPLSFNQEMLAAGYASIEIDHLKRTLPGQGIVLAGQ